jgi:replicative DNA helicase
MGRSWARDQLRRLGLLGLHSWDKFVPRSYIVAPAAVRLEVLRGLMDTDGWRQRSHAWFSSSSEQLRDDVAWLARSLGLTVKVSEKPVPGHRQAFLACIAETEEVRVFRLSRKLGASLPRRKERLVSSVEYLRDEECQCIAVSADSHLYVTDGFIPTHNTAWCVNLMWHCAVVQGKNVVYFTSETQREDIRLRLLARHSMHPQFGLDTGEHPGLNTRDLRAGSLSDYGYGKFRDVLDDWGSKAKKYGRAYVVQLPRGSSLQVVETRLKAVSRQFVPDLVVVDYLALLRPDYQRKDRREDLVSILIDANEVARTALDGKGVPLVSPWQVSREGWKKARESREYDLAALAESQEAGNSADLVVTLLDLESGDDTKGRRVPLQLDILKNRAGERGRSMRLRADYATNCFAVEDKSQGEQAMASLLQ